MAVRFSSVSSLDDPKVNALRHAIWQGAITNRFNAETAQDVGNAHEFLTDIALPETGRFSNFDLADGYVDLRNNELIRSVAPTWRGLSIKETAVAAIGYFENRGLWIVKKNSDGSFSPELYRLTPQEAADSRAQISAKDELGWNPEDPGQDRCESYQSSWDVEPW
jgi:hypothetical protein